MAQSLTRLLTLGVVLTLVITGCSTPRMRGDTATAPTDDGDTYYGTEVAIGPCAVTGARKLRLP